MWRAGHFVASRTVWESNEPQEAVFNLDITKWFERRLLEGWRASSLLPGLLPTCSREPCRPVPSHKPWARAGFRSKGKVGFHYMVI